MGGAVSLAEECGAASGERGLPRARTLCLSATGEQASCGHAVPTRHAARLFHRVWEATGEP